MASIVESDLTRAQRYYRNHRELCLQRRRDWVIRNREKHLELDRDYHKKYREKNPEKVAKSYKIWREKNLKKLKEYNRQWRLKNPERIKANQTRYKLRYAVNDELKHLRSVSGARSYQKNKQKIKIKCDRWRKANPGKIAHYQEQYRCLKKAAAVNLKSIKSWMERVKSSKYATCYYCGGRFPTSEIHFDHIIALVKGGAHSIENLCVACVSCNSSKSSKDLRAWRKVQQMFLEL